jgi:hypothetical protein
MTFCQKANYAGALAIELRRGLPPDTRDFLRFKFKNGTRENFETVHVFGHRADIPLTEFIYRTEVRLFFVVVFTQFSLTAFCFV